MKYATLRIGAVCSASASAIQIAYPLLLKKGIDLRVVTHRESGIETFCQKHEIPQIRFDTNNKEQFSRLAKDWFISEDVDFAILFLDRILSVSFIDALFTVNFHPSLLPAFPGTHALEMVLASKAPYLGATVHKATEIVDGGPIIAQSAYPLAVSDYTLERLNDLSFVQRLALLCNIIDLQTYDRTQSSRGWINPPSSRQSTSDFLSPSWMDDESKALVAENAARRNMRIRLH